MLIMHSRTAPNRLNVPRNQLTAVRRLLRVFCFLRSFSESSLAVGWDGNNRHTNKGSHGEVNTLTETNRIIVRETERGKEMKGDRVGCVRTEEKLQLVEFGNYKLNFEWRNWNLKSFTLLIAALLISNYSSLSYELHSNLSSQYLIRFSIQSSWNYRNSHWVNHLSSWLVNACNGLHWLIISACSGIICSTPDRMHHKLALRCALHFGPLVEPQQKLTPSRRRLKTLSLPCLLWLLLWVLLLQLLLLLLRLHCYSNAAINTSLAIANALPTWEEESVEEQGAEWKRVEESSARRGVCE